MCGRYVQATPLATLADLFDVRGLPEAPVPPRWNIAPTALVPVLPNLPERRIELFRWGLVPSWAKDPAVGNRMINARAETLAEKPSFREALRKRRCLVFADGFYEWTARAGRKVPVHFRLRDGATMTFAGLWERWRPPDGGPELRTVAVVTVAANALLSRFHDRMPALLEGDAAARWIDPAPAGPDALTPLLVPFPAERMEAFEVSLRVNNPRNEGAELVEPAPGGGSGGDAAGGGPGAG